jgi:3-isopropylmalate dehydrogenase
MEKSVGSYTLGVLTGDGIGEEVVPASTQLVEAVISVTGATVRWLPLPFGWQGLRECGDPMPSETKEALQGTDGWILGPHDSAAYPAEWQLLRRPMPGGELRRDFQLYANIRPAKNFPGVDSLISGTDLVVVRENTEGFYCDRNMFLGHGELMPSADVALAIGVFTRAAIERVMVDAFELAQQRRGLLSVVHKANALKASTGLYRTIAQEMAPRYPDVKVDDYHIDAMAALLVRRPQSFDVIVTENMFGDILSDLAGELVGGLGLGAALNAGTSHAMAQAVHGSAPDIAGKDIANPVAEMLSSMMLLRWLGTRHDDQTMLDAAQLGEAAVVTTLAAGERTRDIGGELGTKAFASAVVSRVSTSA